MRNHGTRARYVWGPDEHGTEGKGCRCGNCTQASREVASHRERMIAYGRWQPYVDAGPAREHVRMLSSHGIGWKRVAELAGVATGSMSKLMYGGPAGRPPSRRIRPQTAAAILAVQPSPAYLGDRAVVDATATRRRLQALVAIGWAKAQLAGRLGMLATNFGDLMRRENVVAATERAVATLYDELWNTRPPERNQRERISASRARNYARARGWPPPAAWDDDRIGDPDAAPEGWRRSTRATWRAADLAEEAAELLSLGYSREQAAQRLRVSKDALEAAIARTRERAALAVAANPVAHWLAHATAELHAQMEPGDKLTGISINVISHGHLIVYGLKPGDGEVTVGVYDGSDPEALRRAADALGEAFKDATVRTGDLG